MSITFDSSVTEITFDGTDVTEVIYNGTSVWTVADNRVYVKGSGLPAGISGSTYEAVSDVSDWTSGNLYLLELATGKIYTSL